MSKEQLLELALKGDIGAYNELFQEFRPQLKSYLYRMLADREDAEDLTQDAFIKGFEKIGTFRREASFKTWVFQIATNLAKDELRKRKRWAPDAQDKAKKLAGESVEIQNIFANTNKYSPNGAYEVREHIDFCFTCIAKTLEPEQQVALLLKDVYGFSRKEICEILNLTEGKVKHLLGDARKIMTEIFDARCALVNKNGACHQCTELAGLFNPKQKKREALLHIRMVKEADDADRDRLYELRAALAAELDPLTAQGADFHEAVMQCARVAIGELGRMKVTDDN